MNPGGIYFPNSLGCPGTGWGPGSEEVSGCIVGKVDYCGVRRILSFEVLAILGPLGLWDGSVECPSLCCLSSVSLQGFGQRDQPQYNPPGYWMYVGSQICSLA